MFRALCIGKSGNKTHFAIADACRLPNLLNVTTTLTTVTTFATNFTVKVKNLTTKCPFREEFCESQPASTKQKERSHMTTLFYLLQLVT